MEAKKLSIRIGIILLFLIASTLAGCTAEESRGISSLKQLEHDFDRGHADYYSPEEVERMRAEFPATMDEIRAECGDELAPTPAPRD